jgi:RHS repeat-associated protein
LVPASYTNLITNTATQEANTTDGYSANGSVTLTHETLNNETYVKAVCNQSTGTPGVYPIGGTLAVKPGESYSFKVLGYQSIGTTAKLYVKNANGSDILWPGNTLPTSAATEAWVTSTFTVPAGVTQIRVGVLWNTPASGNTLYINSIALYKTDWEYQYFLNDHLGSTRTVLQTTPNTFTYVATMESQNYGDESAQFFNLNSARQVASPGNATPGGSKAYRMDAATPVGPARSFRVLPGDVIDVSTMAWYAGGGTYAKNSLTAMATAVGSALGGGVTTITEGINGSYATAGNPLFALSIDQGSTRPSAFINYILFNELYQPLEAKSQPVGSTANTIHAVVLPTISVKETGYLFVYLSYDNTSGNEVHFDDFKITYRESPVVQINAYYPYGLTALSWTRDGEVANRYHYQGKEYEGKTGLHDFHARQYDPILGRFKSLDPANQFASGYVGMGNNPVMGVDPDGRFVWLIPQIGWSKEGGLSIGISLVVGIPGGASVQVGGGYNFKSKDGYGYVGATLAFNTVSLSYSGSGGWSAGYTAGASLQSGLPISTNFLTVGANYNISHNSWGGNLSAWQVDRSGWTFNPSVNMMVAPEQTTNFVRGQGFRSNNKVLANFVAAGNHQGALDYFGFEGTYGGEGMSSTFRNRKTGESGVIYRDDAFNSYGDMIAVYKKESFHLRRLKKDKWELGDTDSFADARQPEERLGLIHQRKNSGFYRKIPGFLSRIAEVEGYIDRYNPSTPGGTDGLYRTYYHYVPYQAKWWHRIYRIPRVY